MKYEKKFFAAAREGNVELVKEALADGFPVDHLSKCSVNDDLWVTPGRTGLMWATIGGQAEVVRILLAAGASPHRGEFIPNMQGFSKPSDFRTSWAFASEFDRDEILDQFFAAAEPPEPQHMVDCLEHAARHGSLRVLNALADRGVPLDAFSSEGLTPLMSAARHGRSLAVAFLLHRGVETDVYDRGDEENDGQFSATALHHAISGLTIHELNYDVDGNVIDGPTTDDYLSCIRLLLDAGADPNLEQKGVGYPLAQVTRFPVAVRLLLNAGADKKLASAQKS
jgi:ankyrin repeat protein